MKDEYRESKRISNSSLTWFQISPKYFQQRLNQEVEEETSKSLVWGDMVHKYILEPKVFNETFVVLDYETPTSQQQKDFCLQVAIQKDKAGLTDENLIKIYKTNYKIKASNDKVLGLATELKEKYDNYIQYLILQTKKVIINSKQLEKLEQIKQLITNHVKANQLIFEKDGINELPIYWLYKDELNDIKELECKSKLDRVIIDKENKSITLVDVKTTFDISNFKESVDKYNYARQLAFYWLALGSYFETEMIGEDFDEYTKNTYIVAINTMNNREEVRVFEITESLLNQGLEEIVTVMAELNWHFNNNKWDHTLRYYTNDGVDKLWTKT